MKQYRKLSLLERKLQDLRWRLYRLFCDYDMEQLIGWSLLGVLFVWFAWLAVFA